MAAHTTNRRRQFLKHAGAVAATVTGGLLAPGTVEDAHATPDTRTAGSSATPRRAARALRVRQQAALTQHELPTLPQRVNGDDRRYPSRAASFTKALPHDERGHVLPDSYDALVTAIRSGDDGDFAAVPIGTPGGTLLANPQAAMAFDLIGGDSHAFTLPPPPAFASAEAACEMAELYWRALTRDVPFTNYATDSTIAAAAESLSTLSDFRGPTHRTRVTPSTLFRGGAPGDLIGPHVSQFLWKPVPQGPFEVEQRVRVATAGVNYMTDAVSWLDIQNGGRAAAKIYAGTSRRYICTPRDLAEYVHRDFTYQAFLNAALMLLTGGRDAMASGNPYKASTNQAGFATFGPAQVLDCVASVANLGLHAAWRQKWNVHRRLRPEEFGGRVHHAMTGAVRYPIHADLARSGVLPAVQATTGAYLLPMAYPEGAPTHPAYPAGHATIAGACVTILKAFFDPARVVTSPVEATESGEALVSYAGVLTVGGELNKLASNISFGRDAAGVHWRSDGAWGLYLGEQVALRFLLDLRRCFNERFPGFTVSRFDGTTVTI